MKNYTLVYEYDATGWWYTSVKELPGCHTQGKTLKQARQRIQEALTLFVENVHDLIFQEEVKLPPEAASILEAYTKVHAEAEKKQKEAQELSRKVARLLNQDLHLGLRDTGSLLHLSHQRIHYLVREK